MKPTGFVYSSREMQNKYCSLMESRNDQRASQAERASSVQSRSHCANCGPYGARDYRTARRSRASTVLNQTNPTHRLAALDKCAVSIPICLYMQRDERAPLLSDGQWASLAAALRIDEICAMVVVGDIPFMTDSIHDARAKARNPSHVSQRADVKITTVHKSCRRRIIAHNRKRGAMGRLTTSVDRGFAVEISCTACNGSR